MAIEHWKLISGCKKSKYIQAALLKRVVWVKSSHQILSQRLDGLPTYCEFWLSSGQILIGGNWVQKQDFIQWNCEIVAIYFHFLAFPHSTLFCFWDRNRINICDVDVPPLILWMVVLTQRSWPRKKLLPNCRRNRKYNICNVDVPKYIGEGRAHGNETNMMQNSWLL